MEKAEQVQAVVEQARQAVVDPTPAQMAQAAANHNNVPGEPSQTVAAPTVSLLTPEQHLHNAGIMYAKAAACFQGLYQQEVLAQQASQAR